MSLCWVLGMLQQSAAAVLEWKDGRTTEAFEISEIVVGWSGRGEGKARIDTGNGHDWKAT